MLQGLDAEFWAFWSGIAWLASLAVIFFCLWSGAEFDASKDNRTQRFIRWVWRIG